MPADWRLHPWSGVFAATLCPFYADESLDVEGLRRYARELAAVDGIQGLVCNGHTGEIMSLRPNERAQVTRAVAESLTDSPRLVKLISGVSAEGTLEAIDHAIAAREAHLPHRFDDRASVEFGDVDMLDRGRQQFRLAGVVDPVGVLNLVQRVSFHLHAPMRRRAYRPAA